LQDSEFDLVFLDADKKENMDYLRLIENKLHKGSILIADDAGVLADKMEDYLSYVRISGKYESEYVPVDYDGMEISIKL
jgi:predicted O-methyltransferase YrrM